MMLGVRGTMTRTETACIAHNLPPSAASLPFIHLQLIITIHATLAKVRHGHAF